MIQSFQIINENTVQGGGVQKHDKVVYEIFACSRIFIFTLQ